MLQPLLGTVQLWTLARLETTLIRWSRAQDQVFRLPTPTCSTTTSMYLDVVHRPENIALDIPDVLPQIYRVMAIWGAHTNDGRLPSCIYFFIITTQQIRVAWWMTLYPWTYTLPEHGIVTDLITPASIMKVSTHEVQFDEILMISPKKSWRQEPTLS